MTDGELLEAIREAGSVPLDALDAIRSFRRAVRNEALEQAACIVYRGAPGEIPDVYDALARRIRALVKP